MAGVLGGLQFRRRLGKAEFEARRQLSELEEARQTLRNQLQEFEQRQEEAGEGLREFGERLEQKQRDLSDRLAQLNEWVAFADELNVARRQTPVETERLLDEDRKLLELLSQESERLFDMIKDNRFAVNDKFDVRLLRDELYDLAQRVALIYRPEADRPLLETSPEQLLRASSRVSLHLLVMLEGLPVNLTRTSISDLYEYIRQGVRAYGAYRAAEPYLSFLSHGMYVGRALAAVNPAATGAWWLAMQVGKQGAKALAKRYVNQQAIWAIHELIRIVAYEVAAIYSPGFRWRDEQWVYGIELANLVCHFPPSRESLTAAMDEIDSLQLRSEFDRMFLFRCLGQRDRVRFDGFDPGLLSAEKRQQVAHQLEKFLEKHVHGVVDKSFEQWSDGVTERLQVQITRETRTPSAARSVSRELLIESWFQFLVGVCNLEPQTARQTLAALANQAPFEGLFPGVDLQSLQPHADAAFELLDIDPQSEHTELYVWGLLWMAVHVPEFAPMALDVARQAGVFFRIEPREFRKRERSTLTTWLASRLEGDQDVPDRDAELALAVRQRVGSNERLRWVTSRVRIEGASEMTRSLPPEPYGLIGRSARIELLAVGLPDRTLWSGDGGVTAERVNRMFVDDLRLSGGEWDSDVGAAGAALLVKGVVGQTFDTTFEPVLEHPAIIRPPTDPSSSS